MRNMHRLLLVAVILMSLTYTFAFEASSAHGETVYTFNGTMTFPSPMYFTAYFIPATVGDTWDVTFDYSFTGNCRYTYILVTMHSETIDRIINDNGCSAGSFHITDVVDENDVRDPMMRGSLRFWLNFPSPEIPPYFFNYRWTVRVTTPSDPPPSPPSLDSTFPVNIYTASATNVADGNPYIDIWQVDERGNSYQALYINSDLLLTLPNFPSENMLISSTPDGFISVYKLTTGEYQVNVGPLADGKIHVIIFDAIPPTHTYGYTWDITQ